jgi:hypothetical protein
LNVALEVVEQLVYGLEDVGKLFTIDVPMVALTTLVVVSNSILTRFAEEQPVLEEVSARGKRLRQLPDDDFYD